METLNPELHVPTGSQWPLPPPFLASSGSNPEGEHRAPTCRYSVKKDPSSVFSSCLWAGGQESETPQCQRGLGTGLGAACSGRPTPLAQ